MHIHRYGILDNRPRAIYGAPMPGGAGRLPVVRHLRREGRDVLLCGDREMTGDIAVLESGKPDNKNGLWPIDSALDYKPYVFFIGSEVREVFEAISRSRRSAVPADDMVCGILPNSAWWGGRYALIEAGQEVQIKQALLEILLWENDPVPPLIEGRAKAAIAIDRRNSDAWKLRIAAAASGYELSFRQAAEALDIPVQEVKKK